MSPIEKRFSRKHLIPPSEEANPVKVISAFYTKFYCGEKSDTTDPNGSILSLIRRVRGKILALGTDDWILDLGAGRHIFERCYRPPYGKIPCKIIALDIADLKRWQLLSASSHIRSNGALLPFQNESFSLVVSNLALDFMPPEARDEVYRVTQPNSWIYLNLHHPMAKEAELASLAQKAKRGELSKRQQGVFTFWRYLKENEVLFQNENHIMETFTRLGFEIDRIADVNNQEDRWWEVDMVRR